MFLLVGLNTKEYDNKKVGFRSLLVVAEICSILSFDHTIEDNAVAAASLVGVFHGNNTNSNGCLFALGPLAYTIVTCSRTHCRTSRESALEVFLFDN